MSKSSHTSPDYRIAVVGSGAVGCYYGGRLAQQGREVHFLMRSDFDQVKAHGLQILSPEGNARITGVHCHRTTEDIGPCDLVIIALKSTSNGSLLDLIPPLLKPDTMLLTLQNGLGNEEFLAEHFGGHRVLGGLCFVCINRTAPGVIQHIAQGQISLGEFGGSPQARTQAVAVEFRQCGVPCEVAESLAEARWRKLVWNIPFNGLSIVGGCIDTETILGSAPLEALVLALMKEIIETARKLGHQLPEGLAEDMIARTKTMARYKTSSLIDFVEGREVEVEPIWGEPLRRAAAQGLAMPKLEVLYQLISHAVDARTP
jgi:2-dehydropantoate 2-reductase